MNLIFSEHAWDDYQFWLQTDKTVLKRINAMIKEIQRTPFEGTGKPEPLRHVLASYWSRRITQEHRLVYSVTEDGILIAQLRYHY